MIHSLHIWAPLMRHGIFRDGKLHEQKRQASWLLSISDFEVWGCDFFEFGETQLKSSQIYCMIKHSRSYFGSPGISLVIYFFKYVHQDEPWEHLARPGTERASVLHACSTFFLWNTSGGCFWTQWFTCQFIRLFIIYLLIHSFISVKRDHFQYTYVISYPGIFGTFFHFLFLY